MHYDLLIAGTGPAGLALAAAAVERGLRVVVVGPAPEEPWAPTYASWADELPAEVPVAQRWERVTARAGAVHQLERPYVRVDGEALRAKLLGRAASATFLRGRVVRVEPDAAGATVHLSTDGGALSTARVAVAVTATGAPTATAWQTAHGVFAELSGLDRGEVRWMDFSHDFDDGEAAPTFLYALPFADGTWLVEETALVRSPAVPHAVLERRLAARLAALGVTLHHVLRTERCTIPMDAVPVTAGPSLAFGSAAGMVHPATGYLLARVLAAAPLVADALVDGLTRSPASALEQARAVVWPAATLRRHALLRYGAGVSAQLGLAETRAFFDAFFRSTPAYVRGYLGDHLTLGDLAQGMATMFRRMPLRVQLRVLAAGAPSELSGVIWPASTAISSEATP
jgi:lycopene beta-cyclase